MKKQRVWFITGASRGFGLDIAKAALAAGDKVVATVRNKPEGVIESLQNHQDLLVVTLDVTKEEQVKDGVQKAIARFGRIDVLVNNAGYGLFGALEEATDEETRKQYDTNVFGLLNVTRAVLPFMREKKSGHVVNISSLFGYGASVPGFSLYGSTKYAVEGITEGLALEVNPLGIHVTAVAPGLFRTGFASSDSYQASKTILEAYEATVGQVRRAIDQINGNQPGDPAKLAGVILTLVNSENPPLHLPIGKNSVAAFRNSSARIEKEVTAWEEISNGTDHAKA